jgi:hypothetical protein
MPLNISGDDLETIMDEADDDGGQEYLTAKGFDVPSVVGKAQALAVAMFPEQEENPHKCIAAAYLIGLESGLRATEKFHGGKV